MSAARQTPSPRSLLVVRDDRLGDFMLAWPAFALLRRALPETRITALVPEYTAPLGRLCTSVDEILVVPRAVRNRTDGAVLAERLRDQSYDAVISFFSHYHTARAFRRAGIPVRIAPAVKLAQIHHTHRLHQHRSRVGLADQEKPLLPYCEHNDGYRQRPYLTWATNPSGSSEPDARFQV